MTSNARLENVPTFFELVRISNHALQGRQKQIPGKTAASYSHQVRSCGMMSQNKRNFCVRYFSACCVIILAEYFVLYMLCKCYWILFNNFLNLAKVWTKILYVSLKLSEGRFVFVLYCA